MVPFLFGGCPTKKRLLPDCPKENSAPTQAPIPFSTRVTWAGNGKTKLRQAEKRPSSAAEAQGVFVIASPSGSGLEPQTESCVCLPKQSPSTFVYGTTTKGVDQVLFRRLSHLTHRWIGMSWNPSCLFIVLMGVVQEVRNAWDEHWLEDHQKDSICEPLSGDKCSSGHLKWGRRDYFSTMWSFHFGD